MKRHYSILSAALLGVALHGQADVTIKEIDGEFAVSIDGKPFTTYKHKELHNPCFYPIISSNGVTLTRKYPLEAAAKGEMDDHKHHTSLWYTHGDVNGLDFWHGGGRHPEKGGRVAHSSVVAMRDGEDEAVLKTKNKWLSRVGDKEICQDERRYAFGTIGPWRYIDFQITIKATNGDVAFGDTKEGSMAIRTHPSLRLRGKVANGKAASSAGHQDKDLWGKAAKWVHYWGTIDGKAVGIAIFDHPSNPRHPTTWHARDYGLIAANPFGYSQFYRGQGKDGTLTIKNGKSVTFRYGFFFHPGSHDPEKVEQIFETFARNSVK